MRLRSDSLQLPGRAGKLVLATRNVRRKTGSRTVVAGSPIGGNVSGASPRVIVPARPGSNSTQLRPLDMCCDVKGSLQHFGKFL